MHDAMPQPATPQALETNPDWRFDRLPRPDGGHLRLGHWPEPARPRGTVLVLTGRCECVEKFAETAADLAARGFRVVSMDWRGQGGSSRFLEHSHRGHAPDFETLLDDLDAAIPALLPADSPRPWLVLAHSMGGHLTLRHVLERDHPFDGVILSAPMLGICTPLPEPFIHHVAKTMVANGHAGDYAIGQTDWRLDLDPFEGNPFTSDPVRYRVLHDIYTANPELALGGVTWGWLDAAYRSMAHVMRHEGLKRCQTPVLILSAGKDRVVPPGRHRKIAGLLPRGTLRLYPSARHELLMERDEVRRQVWADIDRWLEASIGLPTAG